MVEVTGENGGAVRVGMAAMQRAILTALAAHPDAKLTVAEALVEVDDHARTS